MIVYGWSYFPQTFAEIVQEYIDEQIFARPVSSIDELANACDINCIIEQTLEEIGMPYEEMEVSDEFCDRVNNGVAAAGVLLWGVK